MGDWAPLLSRRDERTKPGVLTPGTVNFVVRPERATDGSVEPMSSSITNLFRPFGAARHLKPFPGVKTPGLVLQSLRDKPNRPRPHFP